MTSTPRLLPLVLGSALLAAACGESAPPSQTPDDAAVAAQDLAVLPGPADLALPSPCGPCSGATPHCDAKAKRCVACLVDGDCPAGAVCRGGACVPGCAAGHTDCADAGMCDVDAGQCRGCASDKECHDAAAPFCDPKSGRCGPCTPDNDRCPAGQYCGMRGNVNACLPGCRNDVECQNADGGGASFACCAHQCIDTRASAQHCGACGADCQGGACCEGTCKSVQSDVKNCGACGKVCPSMNNMPSCNAGVCGAGGCLMGFGDCNGNAADGCETSLGGDTRNCGACGAACNIANAQALCLGGKCSIGGCSPGFKDCNGSLHDGCEVNASVDIMNCGTCGQNCGKLPNATAGCVNGMCAIGMCDPGFGDCNQVANDGCESTLANDPLHCGGCGKACPSPPNVSVSCTNGACSMGGCVQGYTDCDKDPQNGCEVKLATDVNNCGACGKVCVGMGQNAVAACVNSACSLACNKGWGDCDNNPANGCEKDVNADVAHCGACGLACVNGQSCVGGVCLNAPMCGNNGNVFGNGCVWAKAGADKWVVPQNVKSVTLTMIGGGGGGGIGPCKMACYYPGSGGGSGYYLLQKAVVVTPGTMLDVVVGAGGPGLMAGGNSSFGLEVANGGKGGHAYNGLGGSDPTATGGDGGSGGGAGYTNTNNGGGIGSGVVMGNMAGLGGAPSPGSQQWAMTGQGFGAGGAGQFGTSGYDSKCGGTGGSNGSNGATVGGCGGGGGGAGGLVIPGYNANPASAAQNAGLAGVVWISY